MFEVTAALLRRLSRLVGGCGSSGRWLGPLAVTAALVVVPACSSPHHSSAVPVGQPLAERLAHLRSQLPAGFSAPGSSVPLGAPQALQVAPAGAISPSNFTVAPVPDTNTLKALLSAQVNEPYPLTVRPLFVSAATVKAGGTVTVVATHLSTQPKHACLFILSGPAGFRADHLVTVGNQVAAGVVTIPTGAAPGTWDILVEDLSDVPSTSPSPGTVLVDLGQLTVN